MSYVCKSPKWCDEVRSMECGYSQDWAGTAARPWPGTAKLTKGYVQAWTVVGLRTDLRRPRELHYTGFCLGACCSDLGGFFEKMTCMFLCIIKCFTNHVSHSVTCLTVRGCLPDYSDPLKGCVFICRTGKGTFELLDHRYGSLQCWDPLLSVVT